MPCSGAASLSAPFGVFRGKSRERAILCFSKRACVSVNGLAYGARTRMAARFSGTSPGLHYSESHGAERYNSESSHGVARKRLRECKLGYQISRSTIRAESPPTPISPALTSQEIPLSFAFFRMSSRTARPLGQAVEPRPASSVFRQRQLKSRNCRRGRRWGQHLICVLSRS